MQNEFKCVKPLLKWVGGKTQLLNEVLSKFPTRINDYHEIFIGGGSVLFGLLSLHEQGHIMLESVYAYDLNENLINFYKQVQDNPYCQNFQLESTTTTKFSLVEEVFCLVF